MDKTFEQFIANYSVPLSLPGFFLNLALAGLAGWGVGWLYRRYGTSLSNRSHFSRNFVLLCMTTTVIISVVKSSLALSLGLVGALSIVRFRSAIKEPEELMYLFLCIALGLGFGADQLWPTLGALVMIAPVLIVRGMRATQQQADDMLLMLSAPSSSSLNLEQSLAILDQYCSTIHLKRLDENTEKIEMSFFLNLNSIESLSGLKNELRKQTPEIAIHFLDQKMIALS